MRGVLAIARKDLREVRTAILVFTSIALLLTWSLVNYAEAARKETAALEGARGILVTVLSLAAFVISNGVVARELTSKTQIFLESLPVSRASIFAGKLAVVALGLLVVSGAAHAGVLLALDHRPALLAQRIAVRIAGFDAALVGFFFLLGFLGRYRVPITVFFVVTAAVLADAKGVEVGRFGPLALLDETFATDAYTFPRAALLQCAGLLAFCVAMAAALVAVREGDVPARLAQKMSAREKTFILVGFLAYATAWGALSDKDEKPPYVLADAVATQGGGVAVFLKVDPDNVEEDAALARWLHGELREARSWLRDMPLPPFFLVSRADLDEGVFERGHLTNADGVLYRLRPTRDPRQRERLFELMLHGAIGSATRGRARVEKRHFLLDGAPALIARRAHLLEPIARDDDLALLALEAMPDGPTRLDLDRWSETCGRAGSDAARAAAFVGLRTLARACGEDGVRAFIGGTLGFTVPGDVRALWRTPDIDQALARHCGLDRDAWLALWRKEHDDAALRLAARRAERPALSASIAFDALSSRTRRAVVTIVAALPTDARVAVEWAPQWLETELPEDDEVFTTERALAQWAEGAAIDRTFSSGGRIMWRPALRRPGHDALFGPWRLAEVR